MMAMCPLSASRVGPVFPTAWSYMAFTGENTAMPFNFTGGKINSYEKLAMFQSGLDNRQVVVRYIC